MELMNGIGADPGHSSGSGRIQAIVADPRESPGHWGLGLPLLLVPRERECGPPLRNPGSAPK